MNTLNKNNNYTVHPDDTDVRGWHFIVDETKAGTVKDLVLDDDKNYVKYLDVLVHDLGTDYHYLIPVEEVVFDRHRKDVRLEGNPPRFLETYPRFTNKIPSDYEKNVKMYYSEARMKRYPEDDIRTHENRQYEERSYREDSRIADEVRDEASMNRDRYSEESDDKLFKLEKEKELRKLEFERDMAILDKEILEIKSSRG